ncbi:MAG: carbohydrate-binding domain-containing protein, partial [Nanoarchaeota archaeon]|nr:carbohydrate-binding domain-containing protein [Nanoarchaeota archaeon]
MNEETQTMHTSSSKDRTTVVVIWILIIAAATPQVFSQEPTQPLMCTEPNSLSVDKIKECLEQELIQANQLSDEKLVETLKKYPEIAQTIENKDLTRAINTSIELLEQEEIFGELDNRTIKDVKILNENKKIKAEWFKKYNITDQGCNLTSYNGTRIQTKNITINDKEKAKGLNLTTSCEGKIATNITIKKGNITLTNSTITISDGEINITTKQNITIQANKTQVYIEKELYESLDNFSLTIQNNSVKVKGEVARLNTSNNTLTSITNKEAEYNENETYIGENTTIWLYEKNELFLKIKAESKTKIGGNCTGEENCIQIENDPADELYSTYLNIINDSTDVKKYVDEKIDEYKIRNSGLTSEDDPLTEILVEISYMKTLSDQQELLKYSLVNSAPPSASLTPEGKQYIDTIKKFFAEVYDRVRAGEDSFAVLSDLENKTRIKIYDSTSNLLNEEDQDPIIKLLLFVNNSNLDSEQLRSEINKLNLSFKKALVVNSTKGTIEIIDVNDTVTTINVSFGLQDSIGGNILFSKQGKAEAQINKTKLDIKGNPKNFKVNVESDYLNSKKEEHKLKYDFGEVSMCTECKTVGRYSSERKKPEKILKADSKRLYEITVMLRD